MIYTPLTKKALKICFGAHKDQTDKSGMPYVFHPFHVAEQMTDEYSVCVALLHDVVEDTDITLDDLRAEGFPPGVINALELLTHEEGVPYMDYIMRIKIDPLATRVKLADLEHNSDVTRLDDPDSPEAARRLEKYDQAKTALKYCKPERCFIKLSAKKTSCCGAVAMYNYTFCPGCGKKITLYEVIKTDYDADQTLTTCGKCKENIRTTDRFCGHCGAKSRFW